MTMDALPDFDQIDPGIHLLKADPSKDKKNPAHPSLVVFCTFMGASIKIVAKYVAGYRKLFPHSSMLLIMSNVNDTFNFEFTQASRTKVAAQTILDIKAINEATSSPIFVHAMSNGGALAAARIAGHLESLGHAATLFTHTIVDCAPGEPNFGIGIKAISMQLPTKNPQLRQLGFWILYLCLGIVFLVWCVVLGQENMVTKLRRQWNDPNLFDPTAPRLYLHSKGDALIPPADVQAHARDAKTKGWKDVREELFEKAPHCALIMEDAGRYWDAITKLVAK